jgi:hypothetical protein
VLTGTAIWAPVLPVLKRLLPLPALARLMWAKPRVGPRDTERELHISGLVRRLYASGIVPRDANCLERSLLTYRLLARRNANPELVAGVLRSDKGVVGHAWVTVDGHPVGESAEAIDRYSRVVVFGAEGGRRAR